MSDQWIALDAFFPGSTLYRRLLVELGPAGPLAWVNLICWAKQTSRDGTVKYTCPADALQHLGLDGVDLGRPSEEWLEAFIRLLGRMKQASREYRRSTAGASRKLRVTNYTAWQQDRDRAAAASRKRRQRAKTERDDAVTAVGHVTGHVTPDSDSDNDISPPPLVPPTDGAPAAPPGRQRRRREPPSGNGHGLPDVVTGAIAVIAERHLAVAQADAAAGRRKPVHHEPSWLAAAVDDLDQHAARNLAELAETEHITDPATLADRWLIRTSTPNQPSGDLPFLARCAGCGALTFDCACP